MRPPLGGETAIAAIFSTARRSPSEVFSTASKSPLAENEIGAEAPVHRGGQIHESLLPMALIDMFPAKIGTRGAGQDLRSGGAEEGGMTMAEE